MKFDINLEEEDQLHLETIEASVTSDEEIEFLVEGTITDPGSETLASIEGEDVRPVSVTFETVA